MSCQEFAVRPLNEKQNKTFLGMCNLGFLQCSSHSSNHVNSTGCIGWRRTYASEARRKQMLNENSIKFQEVRVLYLRFCTLALWTLLVWPQTPPVTANMPGSVFSAQLSESFACSHCHYLHRLCTSLKLAPSKPQHVVSTDPLRGFLIIPEQDWGADVWSPAFLPYQ